jgi:mgtE-like transporter
MHETEATSIVKQTLPMLVIMGLGGTVAGYFLSQASASLDLFPGLLVLVPAMQNLRGSISGSLASRLSTALHSGTVRPSFLDNPELPGYVVASLSLSAAMSLIIGLAAYFFCVFLDISSVGIGRMLLVALTVGILGGIVHLFANLIVSFASFRRGVDPDNVAIPSLAILGDIVTILYFLMIVRLVI